MLKWPQMTNLHCPQISQSKAKKLLHKQASRKISDRKAKPLLHKQASRKISDRKAKKLLHKLETVA